MKLTLVILAAGIGSRFGGMKQIEPIGPNGETLLHYSIYDAHKAGFTNFIFVTRKGIESDLKEKITSKLPKKIKCSFAHQELTTGVQEGTNISTNRKKPWGTGHAILAAKEKIDSPFAVINADDYYGPHSYKLLADFLKNAKPKEYCLIGYELANTLSLSGSVSRGICQCSPTGELLNIEEHTGIQRSELNSSIIDSDSNQLHASSMTSLNLWGFQPDFIPLLEKDFDDFIKNNAHDPKAEFYLPAAVNHAILANHATAKIIRTQDSWLGVTYKEDVPAVQTKIKSLHKSNTYPTPLF